MFCFLDSFRACAFYMMGLSVRIAPTLGHKVDLDQSGQISFPEFLYLIHLLDEQAVESQTERKSQRTSHSGSVFSTASDDEDDDEPTGVLSMKSMRTLTEKLCVSELKPSPRTVTRPDLNNSSREAIEEAEEEG